MTARGLVLHFSRCNAPARNADWNRWLHEEYLPKVSTVAGVRSTSHFALTQQPEPGMPSVGFSHVTIFEVSEDVERVAPEIHEHHEAMRGAGQIDRNHCVTGVDTLEAHGRWSNKMMPTESLRGHILAYVMCNDPARASEWDRWNDEVHMPDMLESGAFDGVSRWRRKPQGEWGAQYLTLYDVGEIGVEQAVERSAAIMPGLVSAGRKLDCHVGGLTVTLSR